MDINDGIIMDDYRQWSNDEVWENVCVFARRAQARRQPIYTLARRTRNYIVDVQKTKIVRESEGATSGTNQITRDNVLEVWGSLMQSGIAGYEEEVPYFTFALLRDAMPDIIEHIGKGSQIALKRRSESGPA